MELDKLEHITSQTKVKHSLNDAQIERLTNKFYFSPNNQANKGSEWNVPEGEVERDFAVDMLIATLVEVRSQQLGTQVKLSERAIKWLIKESQEIFKQQPMMIEAQVKPGSTLNIVGDIHG